MERILIIEHNKILSKYLSQIIKEKLNFKVDIAQNMQDILEFVKSENKKYFLALVDMNLPNTPTNVIIKYLLSKKIPSIILTNKITKQIRENILSKKIIDYVDKSDIEDIHYIVHTIKRVYKNQNRKILIVDDSYTFRKITQNILKKQMFEVLSASNAIEALDIIKLHPEIKVIILDYHMPKMTGLEFLVKLRKNYKKDEISVIAVTAINFPILSAKFLKKGANDFIKKPFIEEELVCRVNNAIEFLENLQKIKESAQKDFLTKIDNRRSFYQKVAKYYKQMKHSQRFAVGMIDIDHFKKFNDTYGHETGDKVLKKTALVLKENTNGKGIAARFGGEEFCVLLKDTDGEEAVFFFEDMRRKIEEMKFYDKNNNLLKITVSIGVAKGMKSFPIKLFLNRADKMLYLSKKRGRNRVSFFEKELLTV